MDGAPTTNGVPAPSSAPALPDETGLKQRQAAQARDVGITGTTNFYGDLFAETNTALIRQAAYGVPGTRQWGEWEKIARTDPDCATALDKTVAPLRDSRLGVKPAKHDALPVAQAEAHAAFVEWALTNATPRWPDLSQAMARGFLTYGFNLHEKVWGDAEHPALPGRRGVTIARFAPRLPQSLFQSGPWHEKTLPNGEVVLDSVQQMGVRAGQWESDIRIPASKLVHLTWNREGNNYAGYSAFRPVWYIAKQRENILKLIGVAAIREGAGIPTAHSTGTDADILTKEQRDELILFLMSMTFHENAAIVPPRGWQVEWVYSPASNKTHLVDLYNSLGLLILRVMSAQQVHLGTSGTGSRSVGEVHNAVANEYVQGVVSVLEGGLDGVAKELVEANFGPQPAYPEVEVTLKRSQLEPQERATAAKSYVDAGLLTPTLKDENAAREDLGFEPLTEEEWEEAKERKRANAPPALQPPGELQTPPGGDEDEEPEGKPTPPPARAKASAAFVPRRPLRASEQHLDLVGMQGTLDKAKDDFERGAKPLVSEMLMAALPQVKAAMADGEPSELAAVKLDTARLDAFVAKFLADVYAQGQRQVRGEVLRGKPAPRMTAAAGDGGGAPEPKLLAAQRKQVVRRITQRLSADLEARAIDVVRTGGDAAEVISDALADQVDSAALRTDSQLLTTKAWNGGRDDAARELGGIAEVELSAVLDSGTCSVCESKDGQRFAFDSPEHDANVPPLRDCEGRDNCRCLLIYVPADDGGAP